MSSTTLLRKEICPHSCIPDTESIIMTACQNVIVLPIPFDLRCCVSPIGQSHDSAITIFDSDVPPFDRTINGGRGHEIRVPGVPIYVGDSTFVRLDHSR